MAAEPADTETVSFNHIGVCVGDLEKPGGSTRTSWDSATGWELDVPDEAVGPADGIPLRSEPGRYLVNGRFVLELIDFARCRGPSGPPGG